MPAPKLKSVEANDGSYGGLVLAAFDELAAPAVAAADAADIVADRVLSAVALLRNPPRWLEHALPHRGDPRKLQAEAAKVASHPDATVDELLAAAARLIRAAELREAAGAQSERVAL